MVGRRQRDSWPTSSGDDEIVMIELVDDDGPHDGEDVAFGVGHRRTGSSTSGRATGSKVAAGVVGVLALGGAAMAFSRDDGSPASSRPPRRLLNGPIHRASQRPPSPCRPTSTRSNSTRSRRLHRRATEAPTTTVFDSGAGQIFPTDTPLGLYVTVGDNSEFVFRLDLATGRSPRSTTIERADACGWCGLRPAQPSSTTRSSVGSWGTVVSPDGTLWYQDVEASELLRSPRPANDFVRSVGRWPPLVR